MYAFNGEWVLIRGKQSAEILNQFFIIVVPIDGKIYWHPSAPKKAKGKMQAYYSDVAVLDTEVVM